MTKLIINDDLDTSSLDLDALDTVVDETAAASTSSCVPAGDYTVAIYLEPLKHPRDCQGETNADKIAKSSYMLGMSESGKPQLFVAERKIVVDVLIDNKANAPVGRKLFLRYPFRYRKATDKAQKGDEMEFNTRNYASLLQNCYMQSNDLTPKDFGAMLKDGSVTAADLEALLSDPDNRFYCAVTLTYSERPSADGTRTYENNEIVPRSVTALSEDDVQILQSL